MKRILILMGLIFTIVISSINAQTSKGKLLIGGSSTLNFVSGNSTLMGFGITTTKYKSDADGFVEEDPYKTSSFNFAPKVGFLVADNFAVGLDILTVYSISKDDDWKDKSMLVCVGPFLRYYIPTSGVQPFVEAGGGFGINKSKYESEYGDSDYKSNLLTLNGGAGVAIPVGDRVTFDLLLGYNWLKLKDVEDNPDNERTILGALGLDLGVTVLL